MATKHKATRSVDQAGHAGPTRSLAAAGIRVTDQETARVVAVHREDSSVVGAGCLVSAEVILTCRHVVRATFNDPLRQPSVGDAVAVTLIGVSGQPRLTASVTKLGTGRGPAEDVAVLALQSSAANNLAVSTVEFATPLRHSGKSFSVLGFPKYFGDQGLNAIGSLHAADAKGLVQMDLGGKVEVEGGFSGAPVWAPDLGAFVGIVVTELKERKISWCIPSRILSDYYPELPVRFRVPPPDRPHVHDYEEDDPNLQLFGSISNNGARKLEGTVGSKNGYKVKLKYTCVKGAPAPKGRYVTFITYPDFAEEGREDAYELFSVLSSEGVAENIIYPEDLFTVAAIGDAGDTVLTLNLEDLLRS